MAIFPKKPKKAWKRPTRHQTAGSGRQRQIDAALQKANSGTTKRKKKKKK